MHARQHTRALNVSATRFTTTNEPSRNIWRRCTHMMWHRDGFCAQCVGAPFITLQSLWNIIRKITVLQMVSCIKYIISEKMLIWIIYIQHRIPTKNIPKLDSIHYMEGGGRITKHILLLCETNWRSGVWGNKWWYICKLHACTHDITNFKWKSLQTTSPNNADTILQPQ